MLLGTVESMQCNPSHKHGMAIMHHANILALLWREDYTIKAWNFVNHLIIF
jgi:hypothetical protein